VFKGGYFHSGDLAVMHPDGSVSIQDRSKDIIISGGEVCGIFSPFLTF
jgi:acyl-CoA synthetase (AMP-forming)/AMP-acid ligase II